MSKLIVKSPYIKSSGNAGGYLQYIATRDRVELVPDDRPPTRKQEQLITKLVNDFPELKTSDEHDHYQEHPNKFNAFAFISAALENKWDSIQQSDAYMNYIATRPRAERFGAHGLFGDEDNVDLKQAITELQNYTGNVWTHIISLRREDAVRLGYDNAKVWRDLLRAHRNDIAEAMKISPNDFRWYAAFHDEGDHPHVHMMAWSAKPGQAYLSRDGIEQIRSKLTNDIFKQEMLHLYEQKTVSRDQLMEETRKAMSELIRSMKNNFCIHPVAEQLMQTLSQQLEKVSGKKTYGYLPKSVKSTVDKVVDQMKRLPAVKQCYDHWLDLQEKVYGYYSDKPMERFPLSKQKEFRAIKNMVIKEAERIRLEPITFEDQNIHVQDEADWDSGIGYWDLRYVIENDEYTLEYRDQAVKLMGDLAKEGNEYAQYYVGKLYRDGGLVTPDSVEARYWFRQAAEQGLTVAQYALGKLLLSEDNEVHNPVRGIGWLTIAAQNGSHYAAYRLGKEYWKGNVVEKDTSKALGYLEQSAEAGNQYGQYMLGKIYLLGREVPQLKETAIYWLTKSAQQGNAYAQYFLDRQDEIMPPSVLLCTTRLLHHMGQMFQEQAMPKHDGGLQIDHKRLEQLRDKRLAMGHKMDDHEDQQWGYDMGMSM